MLSARHGTLKPAGGTGDDFRAGIERAITRGWLWWHESSTYVKFTDADAAQRLPTIAELMRIKPAREKRAHHFQMDWQRIATAPFDRDLELAVIDIRGQHVLVFPCRRVLRGWVKADTHSPVKVYPTHWREWDEAVSPLSAHPVS